MAEKKHISVRLEQDTRGKLELIAKRRMMASGVAVTLADLIREGLSKFADKIDEEYRVNWLLDNIPAATKYYTAALPSDDTKEPFVQHYEKGFALGFVGHNDVQNSEPGVKYLNNHLRLIGTVMKSRTADEKRAMVRRFAESALPMFADGRLKPLVGKVFPFAQAAEAHRAMEAGGGFGKIVLKVTA